MLRITKNAASEAAPLIERSIVLLLVLGLILGVLAVLRPFATAILFGTILAIAAWPLRQAMIRRNVRPGQAAALLLILAIVVIAIPILTMAPLLSDQLAEVMRRLRDHFSTAPAPPPWLGSVPFAGSKLLALWDAAVAAGGDLSEVVHPYSSTFQQMLLTMAKALADSVVQAILSLIVATMLWSGGSTIVQELRDVLRRLGGPAAEESLHVATAAVRSVAYGVIGTAVLQAFLLALGLGLAGVPGATTLGFVGLVLATSQIGAPLLVLIWGGAAWWLFANDQLGWGVFMVAWGVVVSMIDNVLKPWLIGRGVRMPISLTILGVFGGFVAFGFLGLFIGPTLIAVTFVLLRSWRSSAESA